MNSTTKTAMGNIKVTFTNNSAVAMTYKIDVNVIGANGLTVSTIESEDATGSVAVKSTEAGTVVKTLADIIPEIKVNDIDSISGDKTIVITASIAPTQA